MSTRIQTSTELPPLILHPFSDVSGPAKLVRSSRASLTLQGFLPQSERTTEELEHDLVEGRYCELRMLFYVGRDVERWIEQCLEVVTRRPEWAGVEWRPSHFISLLTQATPSNVGVKLMKWGVSDYAAIFRRGLGLNLIFNDLPPVEGLALNFVKRYHGYADSLFQARISGEPTWMEIDEAITRSVRFQVYASGEYARLLERSWEG